MGDRQLLTGWGRTSATLANVESVGVDGLATIDGVHLDARSGIAWSEAFLRELDSVGRQCGTW